MEMKQEHFNHTSNLHIAKIGRKKYSFIKFDLVNESSNLDKCLKTFFSVPLKNSFNILIMFYGSTKIILNLKIKCFRSHRIRKTVKVKLFPNHAGPTKTLKSMNNIKRIFTPNTFLRLKSILNNVAKPTLTKCYATEKDPYASQFEQRRPPVSRKEHDEDFVDIKETIVARPSLPIIASRYCHENKLLFQTYTGFILLNILVPH